MIRSCVIYYDIVDVKFLKQFHEKAMYMTHILYYQNCD